jgi:hypothetical protein
LKSGLKFPLGPPIVRLGDQGRLSMEIGRPISIERISERLPSDEAKSSAKRKGASGTRANDGPAPGKGLKSLEFFAPINFEYLPSGKIQLNREARERIIDFFE